MPLYRHLTLVALSCLVFLAAGPTGANGRIAIDVKSGGWGDASIEDIRSVLDSVADVLAPQFPQHAGVRVVVTYNVAGPRVVGRKSSDGAHAVLLKVQGRRWDQFAYQFSHELCHIFSNYDRRSIDGNVEAREHQWLEEALCETVSLVALDRLAARWSTSAPHEGWQEYAPAFRQYAARLRSREHRRLSPRESLAGWYGRNQVDLQADPYLRAKNETIASSLLELLNDQPEALGAIGYLNINAPSGRGFAAYLAAWYECCPEQYRPFVRQLMSLFAIT